MMKSPKKICLAPKQYATDELREEWQPDSYWSGSIEYVRADLIKEPKTPDWITIDKEQQLLVCKRCGSVGGSCVNVDSKRKWVNRVRKFLAVHSYHKENKL